MRIRRLGRMLGIAAGLVALCGAGVAIAAPCYVIIDRNDVVVYRDTVPPFDLSIAGSPERALLRQRGQHLLIAEFDQCYAVGYISPTTGGTASVDDIVMRLQPAIGTSIGSPSGYVTSPTAGSGGGGYTAAPPSAPVAAAAPR